MDWDWFARQYEDIKGHYKWALLGALWTLISWAGNRLLHLIPHMPDWAVWAIVLLASSIVFVSLASSFEKYARQDSNKAQAVTNALMTPSTGFDADAALKTAYNSSLHDEVENNIRTAGSRKHANEREAFYVRLLAIGAVGYTYDVVWAYIFKSQILLLMELNSRTLSPAEVKTFYDKAGSGYPDRYAKYSFEQWMEFLRSNLLIIHTPNGMVGITVRGKDFLKYLIHWGRSADQRAF